VASEIKGTTRGSIRRQQPPWRVPLAETKSQLRKGDFSSREGENDKAHYLPAALYVYVYYLFCAPAHLILREKKSRFNVFVCRLHSTRSSQMEKDL
jgi:hypothetical protein